MAITTGGIHYEAQGRGRALVLVPGLGGVGQFWREQVAYFSPLARVITHDHRGTGRSEKSRIRYSIAQMAQDVLSVMDAADVRRATIVGHSTGGAVAQYLGAHHGDRVERLVLSATWACADAYLESLFRTRQEILRSAGAAVYDRLGKLLCYPPYFISANPHVTSAGATNAIPEIVSSRIDALLEFDSRSFADRIEAPTLLIAADDDTVTPPHLGDALERALPRAQRIRLPRGGHYCPETEADAYNTAIRHFIER